MKIVWDAVGERFFETGVDRGVLYVSNGKGGYANGVAWNGLSAVNESPSGGEPSPIYADNIKYLNLMSAEEFGASIEAYTYPEEFEACQGCAEVAPGVYVSQQTHTPFGFTYRTLVGNDTDGQNHGYKIHIVYNALAAPSERGYATVNDSPEAITLSWDISTTPVDIPGFKPAAKITIDSSKVSAENLKKLEDMLYGTESEEAKLPTPSELMELLKGEAVAG